MSTPIILVGHSFADALGLTQRRFAARAGIAKSTARKWRPLGDAIELGDECADIIETMPSCAAARI
ncbi:hypothetical protein [Nocardia sp. NPDC059691]|uniref:hypothetical protein n=1 Tax=Nocardia TaxID=1817 RepID=UPI00367B5125